MRLMDAVVNKMLALLVRGLIPITVTSLVLYGGVVYFLFKLMCLNELYVYIADLHIGVKSIL
jgi:hypothetical protein